MDDNHLPLHGFVVAAWDEPVRHGSRERRQFITGRLMDGRSFAAIVPAPPAAVYVPIHLRDQALTALSSLHATLNPQPWQDFAGAPLARLTVPPHRLDDALRRLAAAHLPVVESERPRAMDHLSAQGITGPITLIGPTTPGRRVDVVFVQPQLLPATQIPVLHWLSLDLETDRQGAIVAASLAGAGGPGEMLRVGPPLDVPEITCFAHEDGLLRALIARIVARDPDVLTGWNLLDFDLPVLLARCTHHQIPLDLGRLPSEVTVRPRPSGRDGVAIAGRAVLDAMRLVRSSGQRLDDLSLDTVAHALLGEGKTVRLRGAAKVDALERLRLEDPEQFCRYCLRDAELVLQILAHTGLDGLTARRAAQTGVALDLAWTSIPAFERIYGAALRKRHILPPPQQQGAVSGAAGGTVLEAEAGLFRQVLVFDFRSLYPSLMRTFHIDPLAHARALARPQPTDLVAPNGARFDRAEGILPAILSDYAQQREAALANGDETVGYVYKILQNSFYGVLGASGCRYARTELAGAITSFAKLFLTAARDWFEARGHHVLYGDTDSVFILSQLPDTADYAALTDLGRQLASALNRDLAARIERDYNVPSFLQIRCDKAYGHFFISRLRGEAGADGRGRGKGYAGLLLSPTGAEVEVRGMEAVRSDFTPLARRFQVELLRRLFAGEGEPGLRAYCRATLDQMLAGALDAELVYRKALRRPADDYSTETPPVRAARLAGWTDQRGRIDYVVTRAGPEPASARSGSPLDYGHYRDKQLLPIAHAIAQVIGASAMNWLDTAGQLTLFDCELN